MKAIQTLERVPANRLGGILAESRLRNGIDLEAIAERSDFTVGELHDVEAGHRLLDDDLLSEVSDLYESSCGILVPIRHPLTIDLASNTIAADGHVIGLDSMRDDHILEQYLSLVYSMRNRDPGTALHLRDEDVAILATALSEREDLIVERLHQAMGIVEVATGGIRRWVQRHLRAGVTSGALGALSIGALVLVSGSDTAVAETIDMPEPEPDPEPSARERLILPASVLQAGTVASPDATPTPAQPDLAPIESSQQEIDTSAPQSTEIGGWVQKITEQVAEARTAQAKADASAFDPAHSHDQDNDVAVSNETIEQTSTVELDEAEMAALPTPAELGAQAEALLRSPLESVVPDWTIEYLPERAGFRGLTFRDSQTIEVYVRAGDTPQEVAGILAHEVGHAIDLSYLDDEDRWQWLQTRGIEDAPWWLTAYASDFHTGAGDFAEAYALWAVGDPSTSVAAGPPTAAQLDVLASIIAGA